MKDIPISNNLFCMHRFYARQLSNIPFSKTKASSPFFQHKFQIVANCISILVETMRIHSFGQGVRAAESTIKTKKLIDCLSLDF